jgi:UDP-glucose 4-epimerase
VTFESLTKLCAAAMGSDFDASKLDIKFYDPKMFDFGEKKAFPMRGQHFFCSGSQPVR